MLGYRGLKYASTGKSPHQMLMFRPMRLPWKYYAMPRPVIPDNQPGEIVEQHMLKLGQSLQTLHASARVGMLKRQVRNLKEYNARKAVHEHGHVAEFAAGDLVWVRIANPRKNKLQQPFCGPYYIHKMLGEPPMAAVVTMDGENFVTRSLEHLCHYHKPAVSDGNVAETSAAAEQRPSQDLRVYPKKPCTWSCAVAPVTRRMLEQSIVPRGVDEVPVDGLESSSPALRDTFADDLEAMVGTGAEQRWERLPCEVQVCVPPPRKSPV